MKIILAAIILLAFPLSANAECTILHGNGNDDPILAAIITQRVTECIAAPIANNCSFLGKFLGMPDISTAFSSQCQDLGGMVFYSNANFVDVISSCALSALPAGMPTHHVGFPLCMSTDCTNEETEVFAHTMIGDAFGTVCTAAIDVYTCPYLDLDDFVCAAAMANILYHVYDTPEWNDHLELNTTTNEYGWNGDADDLDEFESICESYDGDTVYGDLVYNCSQIPEGVYIYKDVPLCGPVDVCDIVNATEVANFIMSQVYDCPLVVSIP